EGTSWIQEDYEIQKRSSDDTEILLDQKEPTELVEDLGSGEMVKKKLVMSFLKDVEIAKQLQEAIAEADSGYKQIHFNGMSYEDIRPIFERVWDQVNAFMPTNSEIEKEVMKKSRFDLQQKQFAEEVSEKKDDSSSKPVGGSRKKTVAKKRIGAKLNEESAKR
nr:hypothetical protein [Tanacetum cinerariifolium]